MSNPSWPGVVKIGSTVNPKFRLSSLNTGDPFRAYRIEKLYPFQNPKEAEAYCHQLLDLKVCSGEWYYVSVQEAEAAIRKVQQLLNQGDISVHL